MSLILRTATRFMMPLLLLFSIFLLLRGHNEPGGGFAGGLVGAAAFILHSLSLNTTSAREALGVEPRSLVGVGLLFAVAAGLLPMAWGHPFLAHRHLWLKFEFPGFGEVHLGTPVLFDLGVYLVVLGAVLSILLTLTEE